MMPNPNPRVVALMDYAIDQIAPRLSRDDKYADWLAWAARWRSGERSPRDCVDASHRCSERHQTDDLGMWPTLAQLCWGAKEACYSGPTSGWLTIRYIADAMVAFGITFPESGVAALEPPTVEVANNLRIVGQQ